MPKITIKFTAQKLIEKFLVEGDLADDIIEYAPDHGFPDNAELDTINFLEVTYTAGGDAEFKFDYEVTEDDEVEEEDEED